MSLMEQLLLCLNALLLQPIRIRSFVFFFQHFQISRIVKLCTFFTSHIFKGLLGNYLQSKSEVFPSKPKSNSNIIANESAVEKKTGPAGFVIGWKMGNRDCE